VRGDGTVDDTQRPGHGFGVTGKQKAQWKRYAEHPLAHGLIRQDFIHQKSCAVCHSSCPTAKKLAVETAEPANRRSSRQSPTETAVKSFLRSTSSMQNVK
jgi:hypothetical protein